jgi:hypothetical protein
MKKKIVKFLFHSVVLKSQKIWIAHLKKSSNYLIRTEFHMSNFLSFLMRLLWILLLL